MKYLWVSFLALVLSQVQADDRPQEMKDWDKFEDSAKVFNATSELRSAISEGISDALARQFDISMNATRALEKLIKLLNNGSINLGDVVNYLPTMIMVDAQNEVAVFLKNLKKNAIKNVGTFNKMINTLTEAANETNAKTLPERVGIQQPATILDTVAGFGRVAVDSILNTLYWTVKSIPKRPDRYLKEGEDKNNKGEKGDDDDGGFSGGSGFGK